MLANQSLEILCQVQLQQLPTPDFPGKFIDLPDRTLIINLVAHLLDERLYADIFQHLFSILDVDRIIDTHQASLFLQNGNTVPPPFGVLYQSIILCDSEALNPEFKSI